MRRRLTLNRTLDTVIHTPHPYSGIMIVCQQCRRRCVDKSPIFRKVFEPMIFYCKHCDIEWAVEPTDDYRER
jgi:hypothetical protein